jgi:hypothetical protein
MDNSEVINQPLSLTIFPGGQDVRELIEDEDKEHPFRRGRCGSIV